MFEAGLVDEVRGLAQYRDMPALRTVGYREVFDYLDGHISLDEALALVQRNTRRYAKRRLHGLHPSQIKLRCESLFSPPECATC